MAAQKNKKKKKWIVPVVIVAVAAVFLFVFVAQSNLANSAAAVTDITRAATAEEGTISATVVGSGTLSAEGTVDVKIPAALEVERVEVEAGDVVAKGDVIATLDPNELQSAILETQGQLDTIDAKIEDAKGEDGQQNVKSSVSGRVKQVFAAAGDDTETVIREKGSLMVLSIDGKMKVTFAPKTSGLKVGDDVTVVLSDGTKKDGEVIKAASGSVTVTLTDNGPEVGEAVTVRDEDGNEVGAGKLEISTPLKVYSSEGVVKSVEVEENDSVSASTTLLKLTQSASNEYDTLLNERAQYEKVLDTLISYSASGTVTAEFAGTVKSVSLTDGSGSDSGGSSDSSGGSYNGYSLPVSFAASVSKDGAGGTAIQAKPGASDDTASISLLTYTGAKDDNSGAGTLALLSSGGEEPIAAAGDGDDPGDPVPVITQISGALEVYINNPVTGNTPQSTIMPGAGYTGTVVWDPPVTKFEQLTAYTATVTLQANAGYHFAADAAPRVTGAQVGGVTAGPEAEANKLTFTAVFPPTQSADTGMGGMGAGSSIYGAAQAAQSGAGITVVSGGGYSGAASAVTSSASTTTSTDSLWQTAASLETGAANQLSVSIDELDILSLRVGQTGTVVLDALPGQEFTATVTKLSAAGSTASGVTTYPVTLEITGDGLGALLPGMNATATIVTDTKDNVVILPLAALQESGGKQFVYIQGDTTQAQDGQTMILGEQREVETGISDGANVEILSGVSAGETVVYSEAISETNPFAAFMMGGGMGGSGGPPAGGPQGG